MKIRFQATAAGRMVLTAALLMNAMSAEGAPPPEQKCQGAKNMAAGKFAACMGKAEKNFISSGDPVALVDAQTTCHDKLAATWTKLEAAAVEAGTTCPSTGDQADVESFLTSCQQSVADALGGGMLGADPLTCEADLAICDADLTTCNGSLGTCTTDLATCDGNLMACDGDLATCNGDLGTCTNDLSIANSDLAVCDADLLTCNGDLSTCNASLAACNAAPGAALPRTGQVLCYDSSNLVTPCGTTGQDGQFQAGVARTFTDNGDGTITDHATGLMWERQTDDSGIHDVDNAYTWANAFTKIATLNTANFAGHNDWRVPNIVELASLRDFSASNPSTFSAFNSNCTTSCSDCSCTRYINDNFRYWSSTYLPGNAAAAEQVLFGYGRVTSAFKTDARLVRAVRGGS